MPHPIGSEATGSIPPFETAQNDPFERGFHPGWTLDRMDRPFSLWFAYQGGSVHAILFGEERVPTRETPPSHVGRHTARFASLRLPRHTGYEGEGTHAGGPEPKETIHEILRTEEGDEQPLTETNHKTCTTPP
eukprot:scaffold1204_cov313-Pavlova_lutheri.AAC.6